MIEDGDMKLFEWRMDRVRSGRKLEENGRGERAGEEERAGALIGKSDGDVILAAELPCDPSNWPPTLLRSPNHNTEG
jgi:hypothetical protein